MGPLRIINRLFTTLNPISRPGTSPIRTLFSHDGAKPNSSVHEYNRNMRSFLGLLKENHLDHLITTSLEDNIELFGIDKTTHTLMDFVCVKSLSYHYSPTQDYFEHETLKSKMITAGWPEEKLPQLDTLIELKRTLNKRYGDVSIVVENLNRAIKKVKVSIVRLKADPNHDPQRLEHKIKLEENLSRKRDKVLQTFFRDSQYEEYNDILEEVGVKTDADKKMLALTILEVLYAQRNLVIPGTFGYDIRCMLGRNEDALIDATTQTRFFFPQDQGKEYNPTIISLLGDGEIFHVTSNIMHENERSSLFQLSRKMMLTNREWKEIQDLSSDQTIEKPNVTIKLEKQKQAADRLIDTAKFYSTLYLKTKTGEKVGIFRDAYEYAIETGKSPEEVMTAFMMRHTELVMQKRSSSPFFWWKTNKIMKELKPYIEASDSPIIFYDTGLKGTFPALLASLVEIYMHKKGKKNILDGRPNAFGYLYAVDEASPEVFPHMFEGHNNSRFVDDAPRFSSYDRDIAINGVTLSKPGHNLLALIYYRTMMEIKQSDEDYRESLRLQTLTYRKKQTPDSI